MRKPQNMRGGYWLRGVFVRRGNGVKHVHARRGAKRFGVMGARAR